MDGSYHKLVSGIQSIGYVRIIQKRGRFILSLGPSLTLQWLHLTTILIILFFTGQTRRTSGQGYWNISGYCYSRERSWRIELVRWLLLWQWVRVVRHARIPVTSSRDREIYSLIWQSMLAYRWMKSWKTLEQSAERTSREMEIRSDLRQWDHDFPEIHHELIVRWVAGAFVSMAVTSLYNAIKPQPYKRR